MVKEPTTANIHQYKMPIQTALIVTTIELFLNFIYKTKFMEQVKDLRSEVVKYIETADEKTVKMVHAMLEVDAGENWWDEMPDRKSRDVEAAMRESESGEGMSHEEVKKTYSQWFAE